MIPSARLESTTSSIKKPSPRLPSLFASKGKRGFYISINKLAPQPRKILQLLRLRQLHNGAFIRLNKATIGMLRRVEPNITYGYLNRKTISDMIYKRGHIKVHGMRVPI